MKYVPEITFDQAKELAMEQAFYNLDKYRKDPLISLLSDDYLEAECCWFFFRNKGIIGNKENKLGWACAYAISKKGDVSLIADMSDEQKRLYDYLQTMSNYFKERNL